LHGELEAWARRYASSVSPVEHALVRSLRWLTAGLLSSLLLVALPNPDLDRLLLVVTFHLGAVVAFGLGVGLDLARYSDTLWFVETNASQFWRRFGALATIVALTTGVVALVTLASSAALGYEPSLQFLQLLSALDIAWATAGLMLGVRAMTGDRWALFTGLMLAIVCIWSIWRYLDVVGFAADGGWLVSGADLWRYVLPFDIAAAVMAITALVLGVRSTQATAQRRPQS
jgi:hypothetical protein